MKLENNGVKGKHNNKKKIEIIKIMFHENVRKISHIMIVIILQLLNSQITNARKE